MKAFKQTSAGIQRLECPNCKKDVLIQVNNETTAAVIDPKEFGHLGDNLEKHGTEDNNAKTS